MKSSIKSFGKTKGEADERMIQLYLEKYEDNIEITGECFKNKSLIKYIVKKLNNQGFSITLHTKSDFKELVKDMNNVFILSWCDYIRDRSNTYYDIQKSLQEGQFIKKQ